MGPLMSHEVLLFRKTHFIPFFCIDEKMSLLVHISLASLHILRHILWVDECMILQVSSICSGPMVDIVGNGSYGYI